MLGDRIAFTSLSAVIGEGAISANHQSVSCRATSSGLCAGAMEDTAVAVLAREVI